MRIATWGRNLEKRVLRPFFRRLKRFFRTAGAHDRIACLEQRLEALESLFREQAGLHYLRLATEDTPAAAAEPEAPQRRCSA